MESVTFIDDESVRDYDLEDEEEYDEVKTSSRSVMTGHSLEDRSVELECILMIPFITFT